MIVKILGDEFVCSKAERYADGVHLYNEDGKFFCLLSNSIDITEVEGGEIVVVEAPEPTADEDMMAMLVDQEYRLTLLELGLTE